MPTQENDISRFAFYQAGKCVVQLLLLNGEGLQSYEKRCATPHSGLKGSIQNLEDALLAKSIFARKAYKRVTKLVQKQSRTKLRFKEQSNSFGEQDGTKRSFGRLGEQGNSLVSTSFVTPIKKRQINSTYLPFIETRINFESECAGLYAGKASELFVSISNIDTFKICTLSKAGNAKKYKSKLLVKTSSSLNAGGTLQLYKRICILGYKNKSVAEIPAGLDSLFPLRLCLVKLACKKRSFFCLQGITKTKLLQAQHNTAQQESVLQGSLRETYVKLYSRKAKLCKGYKTDVLITRQMLAKLTCKNFVFANTSIAKQSFATHLRFCKKSAYSFLWQSDVDLSERIKAIFLIQSILVNGSIYSKNFFNLQKSTLVGDLNKIEIKDKKVFDLFQNLEEQMTNVYLQQTKSSEQNRLLGSFVKSPLQKSGTVKRLVKTSSSLINPSSYPRGGTSTVLDKKLSEHNFDEKPSLQSEINELRFGSAFENSDKKLAVPGSYLSGGQTFQSDNCTKRSFTNSLSKKSDLISQKREISALCEEIVCQSLTYFRKPYGHWFRIYLPQIETHQRQPISKDQFYKKYRELDLLEHAKIESLSISENKITKGKHYKNRVVQSDCKSFAFARDLIAQRSLYKNGATQQTESFVRTGVIKQGEESTQTFVYVRPQKLDYDVSHTVIMNNFYRTFNLLGENRELLDILADHLIRFGKIRAPEILRICSLYVYVT